MFAGFLRTMIIADTHVHVYPCYDAGILLASLTDNLGKLGGKAVKAGFLAERRDCDVFASMRDGKYGPLPPGIKIVSSHEKECMVLDRAGSEPVYLFAGRQIVTSERLEMLGLAVDAAFPDGLTAEDAVRRVQDAGGVPVLAWSPGKWFGRRGEIVGRILQTFKPGELLIGDSSLRPPWWGKPELMIEAERRGFTIVAGSDPLPFSGEESLCGTYAVLIEALFDVAQPVLSVRQALLEGGLKKRIAGMRNGTFKWMLRQFRMMM